MVFQDVIIGFPIARRFPIASDAVHINGLPDATVGGRMYRRPALAH